MATYPPPNFLEPLSVFNPANWETLDITLTTETADTRYLKYPVAQGLETLQDIIVNGSSTFNNPATINNTATFNNTANFDTNIVMTGTALTNYLEFPDGTKQYTASGNLLTSNNTWTGTNAFNNVNPITTTATMPATTDSSNKIPTTAWVQSAIQLNSSPILSSVGYYPAFNKTIGTWQTFNTPTNTQFVDIYTIGGGGNSGSDATNPTLGWSKGIGGCGGGGGMVLNSRVSYGNVSNAIAELNQPQFVCGTTNTLGNPTNLNYTQVWNGTFTQSGTTITLTTTTSGAMTAGTIITFTKSAYETAYPSTTTPYGAIYNQLIVVSGAGTSWQVVNTSSQTLSTAITATGYTPSVIWEGTFSQTGFIATAVSTTSGSFSYNSSVAYYLTCNSTANNIQLITDIDGSGNITLNTSMNVGATGGRILKVDAGNNLTTRFWSYGAGVNNAYTYFPYIAWCEGGYKGTNGTTNGAQEFGGQGGWGGTCVNYLPAGSEISNGGRGQNGGVNGDPSGFTKISGQGGYSYLANGKVMTINSLTSPTIGNYNQGSSTYSPSAFAVTHYMAGQGGCVLVCYEY